MAAMSTRLCILRRLVAISALVAATAGNAQFGVLDPAFGTGGTVIWSDMNFSSPVTVMAVLPNDRIVAAGSWGPLLRLQKLMPDGTPDISFGVNGSRILTPISATFFPESLLLAPNGDILVLGRNPVSPQNYQFAMVRFTGQGNQIASFGPVFYGEVPGDLWPMNAALDSNGRIVVCAGSNDGTCLLRFMEDGSFDPSFGNNGVVLYPSSGTAGSMVLDPDGGIVISGRYAGTSIYLTRFDETGQLDLGFGDQGVVITDVVPGIENEFAFALGMRADGSLIVGGILSNNNVLFVEHYSGSGVLDQTFGTNGRAITDVSDFTGRDLLVQADGAVILAGNRLTGSTHHDIILFRLLADGSPDPTFGEDGMAVVHVNESQQVNVICDQSDGRIIIGGGITTIGMDWLFARLTCEVDVAVTESTFESIFEVNPNPSDGLVHAIASAPFVNLAALDPQGRTIFQSTKSDRIQAVDFGTLPNGVYFIKVQLEGGIHATRRIVISH